jgi:hypothetical protein
MKKYYIPILFILTFAIFTSCKNAEKKEVKTFAELRKDKMSKPGNA